MAQRSENGTTNQVDRPFTRYTLGVVLAAYKDFESRVEGTIGAGTSKPKRIEKVLSGRLGKVTKADIVRECPDISLTTIERTLHDLLAQGRVEKVNGTTNQVDRPIRAGRIRRASLACALHATSITAASRPCAPAPLGV